MANWFFLGIVQHLVSAKRKAKRQLETKDTLCLTSPTIRSYVKRAFRQISFLNGAPFYWDASASMVKCERKKLRLAHFYFNFLYAFLYSAFVVVRCLQGQLREDISLPVKILLRFQAVYFSLLIVLLAAVSFKHKKDIPALLNGIFDLARAAEGMYIARGVPKPRTTRLFELVFIVAYWSLNGVTFMLVMSTLMVPAMPYLPSSLLQNPYEMSVAKVMCVLSLCYVEYVFLAAAHITVVALLLIGPTLIILLNGLSDKNCQVTLPTLRRFPHKSRMYVKLQVLMAAYNDCCCIAIIPSVKLALVIIVMLCTYGAIKFDHILAAAMGLLSLFCVTILVTIFTCLSQLELLSSKLLDLWRCDMGRVGDPRWVKMRIHAMRKLRAHVGSFYSVDRHMVGRMVMSIIDETVTFLYVNR